MSVENAACRTQRAYQILCFLLSSGRHEMQQLDLYFERIIPVYPNLYTPNNFTDVAKPRIFVGFNSHSLKCVTKAFSVQSSLYIRKRWAGFPGRVLSMTRLKSLGSLRLKALTRNASHFNHQGSQQPLPIQLIYIKHNCKLYHQNPLVLETVSTMAVQFSLGDSLINFRDTLSLTLLGSSIFPWLKVALGKIINW